MNKTQLIILWVGAALFIFCLWNPAIVPHTRYKSEEREYTNKEWERELSHYNLSLDDSKETLNKAKGKIIGKRGEKYQSRKHTQE